MDEMMAAMVLTSLSCSPVVQSPPGVETNFSGEEWGPGGFWVWQRPTSDLFCFGQLIAYVAGLAAGFLESLLPGIPEWLSDTELAASILFPQFPPLGRSFLVHCEDD